MLIAFSFALGKAYCLTKLEINSCFRLLPMYFLYSADMCVQNVCLIWKFHSLMYSHTDFNKRILSNTLFILCTEEKEFRDFAQVYLQRKI